MNDIRNISSIEIGAYLSLMIFGLIFLIPNCFSESPAIFCDSCSTEMLQKIGDELKIQPQTDLKGTYFVTTAIDEQLAFFQKMRKSWPRESFHLDMISNAPRWLKKFGFQPMRLGLDLRGGVHFVLEADIDSVILQKSHRFLEETDSFLKQKIGLEHFSLTSGPNAEQAVLQFADRETMIKSYTLLTEHFPQQQYVYIADTNAIGVSLHPIYETQERIHTIEQCLQSLERRVNELGVSEATLYLQGTNQIVVDLPGVQDVQKAKRLLGKTATIDFYLVNKTQKFRNSQSVPAGISLKKTASGQDIFVIQRPILSGQSITFAQAIQNADQKPAVELRIAYDAAKEFRKFSAEHIGDALAVMYTESYLDEQYDQNSDQFVTLSHRDEKIINIATIRSALGERFQISGLSHEESYDLALLLRAGSLPAPTRIIEEKILGPSLGAANIEKSLKALSLGLVTIITTMILYYRRLGVIAAFVLISNFLFLIAILSIIQATLTLTAIAGIILTLGMAVDANVLIFERMRDEYQKNPEMWHTLNNGVNNAYETILDSNLTTMVIGVVLFFMSSGMVKGFALTLMIGLVTSMISSIWGTRIFIKLFFHNPKSLKFFETLRSTS